MRAHVAVLWATLVTAAGAQPPARVADPGAGPFIPEYDVPAAGSYDLPVIDTLEDHGVLDSDGQPTSLFALKRDRVAVVAFVYTTCAEAAGCPLSMAVLDRVDRALAADPGLARGVALVTVSFDPERDTPARMAVIRRFHAPRTDWRFVTTASPAEVEPILLDFHQPVAKLRYPNGDWSGLFRHVLKVFLVDRANRVRNVYSAGFLDPRLVLADLRTLAGVGTDPHHPLADVVAREQPDQRGGR